MLGIDAGVVDAVLADWKTATVDDRLRSALRLLEAMTLRPHEIDSKLIAELEAAGLSYAELEEIATVAFQFNFINRIADAVDFQMPDANQTARQARVLNLLGRVVTGGKRPVPSWTIGNDGLVRPAELNAAREQLLSNSGSVDPELRNSIEATAAALWNARRPSHEIPEVLEEYVKPLTLHAYRIYDGLVANLTAAGYSEQELFEITLPGAFGAAVAAQEQLFKLLYGGDENRTPECSEPTADSSLR
ncbi:MAG: hypothetical protein GY903_32060 [Fuerstiella sp.]|nr:hypothetical protein [Fuerstiella sp.]MCP4859127.1 hypothetical protein [Fuerstiella sp.]